MNNPKESQSRRGRWILTLVASIALFGTTEAAATTTANVTLAEGSTLACPSGEYVTALTCTDSRCMTVKLECGSHAADFTGGLIALLQQTTEVPSSTPGQPAKKLVTEAMRSLAVTSVNGHLTWELRSVGLGQLTTFTEAGAVYSPWTVGSAPHRANCPAGSVAVGLERRSNDADYRLKCRTPIDTQALLRARGDVWMLTEGEITQGNLGAARTGVSRARCALDCQKSATCGGFVHDTNGNRCQFKQGSFFPSIPANTPGATTVTYVALGSLEQSYVAWDLQGWKRPKVVRSGATSAGLAGTLSGCLARCTLSPTCDAFNFDSTAKQCTLVKGPLSAIKVTNAEQLSGFRVAPKLINVAVIYDYAQPICPYVVKPQGQQFDATRPTTFEAQCGDEPVFTTNVTFDEFGNLSAEMRRCKPMRSCKAWASAQYPSKTLTSQVSFSLMSRPVVTAQLSADGKRVTVAATGMPVGGESQIGRSCNDAANSSGGTKVTVDASGKATATFSTVPHATCSYSAAGSDWGKSNLVTLTFP